MGGTPAANAIDAWSSYNPQPSTLAAEIPASMSVDCHSPHFRWGAWGCGTFILGLVLYLPFAVILLAIFGPEVGCPLGLLFGFLFAGILCYRAEKNAPARKFKRDQARREREAKRKATRGENSLERWLRERADFRQTNPELSYEAYLAERGMGNMSTTGRAVVGWLAMKHLGTVPCLLDFQLWKAEKQGKMKKSTGWAIRLALIDWSRSRRLRQEEDERMRRQAEYVAEAMKTLIMLFTNHLI